MFKNLLAFLLFFIPLYVSAQAFAPDADWRFVNYSGQNHFISLTVQNAAIDKYGYLWTAAGGVQKFDGFNLEDYNSFALSPGSLKHNYTDIITDPQGRVWVSSLGLCYYDNATNKFVYCEPDAKHKLEYAYAFAIQNNYLWFVCNWGLAKLNLKTLKITLTPLTSIDSPISSFSLDSHTLLVSSREKLYIYDTKNNTYSAQSLIYNRQSIRVLGLEVGKGCYYVTTNNGLFSLNLVHNTAKLRQLTGGYLNDLVFMPQDKDRRYLFIGTRGRGILVYDVYSKKDVLSYTHDENNPYSLINNQVSKFFLDKEGRLWVGTSAGLSLLDIANQHWKIRFIAKKDEGEKTVSKIATDKFDSTKVWLACSHRGMIKVNWGNKAIERVYGDKQLQLVNDFVQIGKSKWLLVAPKAIMEWGPETGVTHVENNLPIPDSLNYGASMRFVLSTENGTCYITTNRGLFEYSLVTHKLKWLTPFTKNQSYDLLNGFCTNGQIWVAATSGGVFNYNPGNGKYAIYAEKDKLDCAFYTVVKSKTGQLICPGLTGLSFFNTQTKTFKHIHAIANLNKPGCFNAIERYNTIWLSSEVGILNYNPVTQKSLRALYRTPLMEIYGRSPFAVIGKEIAIGFIGGYIYFNEGLNHTLKPSVPVIESVTVNGVPVVNQYAGQNLRFKHTDNSVKISFTAFLYAAPGSINFRYKLNNSANWQYTNGRSADYEQLAPGNYTFFLQSGNENGEWNSQLATMKFTILPPFWATWWFRLVCVILIAFVLYQFYQYKIRHLKAIESIRESIASDFHDDLGSTLTSISIFSEVAVQKADADLTATKNMVGDIGLRARTMIHSMNDMVWTIKPENDNLYKLMQRMQEFSYPVAEVRDIQLIFTMDEHLYTIKTDMLKRKSLFLIFKEAFNNAVKYSGATKIEALFELKNKKLLQMKITDNGKGFDSNKIKPGNGLANMQKRASEIKGQIKITSAPGKGTCVDIQCKIT